MSCHAVAWYTSVLRPNPLLTDKLIILQNDLAHSGNYIMGVTKLVLDVLKTLKGPTIIDLAKKLVDLPGVEKVHIKVNEVDVETLTLTIIVEGSDIDFDLVKKMIEEMGAVIHSVDEVAAHRGAL